MKSEEAEYTQDQIKADKFYMENGNCCSGCDHWRGMGGTIGECTNSKIMPWKDIMGFLGWENCTMNGKAGHAITRRDYVCGQFKDDFNWESLPLLYLKRIGYKK